MTETDHPDVHWRELTPAELAAIEGTGWPQAKRRPTRKRTEPLNDAGHPRLDGPSRVAAPCRCWRCRAGGISATEAASADRIFARHLLRLPLAEREAAVREWAAVPNHYADEMKIWTWIEIESGSRVAEPKYQGSGHDR